MEGFLHRRCGGRYAPATETVTVRASGMAATVDRAFFRCDKCGDERRTVEQRESAEGEAVARMRASHALLTPREIRQLRERLGLTPHQLGELLYGIPRGVVEGWERGRYLQNPQVDALLRSLGDREALERRAARAGVVLPPLPGSEPAPDGAPAGPPAESTPESTPESPRSPRSPRSPGSTIAAAADDAAPATDPPAAEAPAAEAAAGENDPMTIDAAGRS